MGIPFKYRSEIEHERFTARLAMIAGTPLAKELRKYRKDINKRSAIMERGVRADVTTPTSGPRVGRGQTYRAHDEIELCHKFLDSKGVPSATFG